MRDLVALSTLPAVWIGLGLAGIARSLAGALVNTLSLDLIYIRLAAPGPAGAIEVIRGVRGLDARQETVAKDLLRPLLERRIGNPDAVDNPFGTGTLRTVVINFGIGGQGALVACSSDASFPTEQDRLLLGVGANQTAIVLQRRAAEDQEHQQREWLRVTLSSIGDAVIAMDMHGRVTFLNSAAESLTGWLQADAYGKPVEAVFEVVDQESGQLLQSPLDRALRRDGANAPQQQVTLPGRHALLLARGGAEHAIDDSVAPIRDSTGEIIGVVAVFRSVSEQRRAEQLRNMRLGVTQVLNQATSVDHAIVGVLRAVCENLGWIAGFFWAIDSDCRQLVCRASWQTDGMPVPEFEADSRGRRFARGEGLPGRVWASRAPAWVPMLGQDAEFLRHASATRLGLNSAFACPVVIGERIIGVIEFFSKRIRQPERDLLETIATVAGNVGQFIERKSAEDELRRSEQELAEFFENATVGLHWVGPDGRILRANRAELDMLGYRSEEYVGHSISDFHVDQDVIHDILEKLKAGKKLEEYPARLRCKDGSIKHVLIDSSVMWRDGEFIHTRCFTRDITARKEAEAALARARAQLDSALEAGAIATWTWDIPENRLHADRHLARLFNLPASEADGGLLSRYLESIHPDDLERVTAALARSVRTGEEYSADYRIAKPDGTVRWVSARGRTECDAAGHPIRMPGVLVDITERKVLEEELRVRLDQLAEADRRKDEFLATLAHELRNPLAPIRNSLEILKMPRLDAATMRQTHDIMERQVHHLVRLVDDLLDVSRVMRGKIELRKEPIELATVVARAVEMAQSLIEAQGHQLGLSMPERSLLVSADPVRLTQVIGNLLTNSAKYTEPNGHIWLSASAEGSTALLTVRDDGIGISPETLPHVFELFVQDDHASTRAAGGLGIGLTLVRNLVQMHGGTVQARSAGLGKGSEFVVRLPLLGPAGQEVREPREGSEAQVPAATALKVLVVDDNEDAALSLATLLRLHGHQVRVAHDGASAIAAATSYLPNLVFLDIGMPGMDGYEVARRIRGDPRLGPTVLAALTGWGQQEDRRRTAEAGFDHHMVKPPDPETVIRLLDSLSLASA